MQPAQCYHSQLSLQRTLPGLRICLPLFCGLGFSYFRKHPSAPQVEGCSPTDSAPVLGMSVCLSVLTTPMHCCESLSQCLLLLSFLSMLLSHEQTCCALDNLFDSSKQTAAAFAGDAQIDCHMRLLHQATSRRAFVHTLCVRPDSRYICSRST